MSPERRAGQRPARKTGGGSRTAPPGARGGEGLERVAGHRFRDPSLLEEALTHRSFAHEAPPPARGDNERLEFLGDAVLGLAAARYLGELFPGAREGDLTRWRAALVREEWLAEAAGRLGLGEHLLLGRGEELSGGRGKPSILAGAVEALAGAVFLDGGWRAAYRLAKRIFPPPSEAPGALREAEDPKTRLQELAQETHRETPRYRLVSSSGPSHSPRFTVSVSVAGRPLAEGEGASKKEAEQAAARTAVETIRREGP